MLKFHLLAILTIISITNGDDDNYNTKTCTDICFCSTYRNLKLKDPALYTTDIQNYQVLENVVFIPLKNPFGDNLVLEISLLANSTARIKIGEPKCSRLQLSIGWSLCEEPKKVKLSHVNDGDETLFLHSDFDSAYYQIIIHKGPPFNVQFYLNGDLKMTFKGEKLMMEKTYLDESFTFSVEFAKNQHLYGLYDHAFRLRLPETKGMDPFRFRNCDASEHVNYKANSPAAMYGSYPVIYGHSAKDTCGIFLHNAAQQWIDISYSGNNPTAYFMVESAHLDLFLLLGPSPEDAVKQFSQLTGKAPLPPYWSLGYHQWISSYNSQDDVKTMVALMQENGIPMDVIWLSPNNSDANWWISCDEDALNGLLDMKQIVSAVGKRVVVVSEPFLKTDVNNEVYIGAEGKYFVKTEDGRDFEGVSVLGQSKWIDYFLPSASDYYSSWYYHEKFNASSLPFDGMWNNMNEPSVLNGLETSFTPSSIHRLDDEGTNTSNRDVHNLYGLLQVKSTYEGLMIKYQGKLRPFIVTRSHFAGSHRYAAAWTGDNSNSWEHFANSISECLTANLVGMVFCGANIGGYFGKPSHELVQRWFQGGAWLTLYGSNLDTEYKKLPLYSYPEDVRKVIRSAIELRYRHIQQFYTAFFEHGTLGYPVISPLFYRYPGLQEYDSQILLGRDIMAVAVVNISVKQVPVYFPGEKDDIWYRVDPENLPTCIGSYHGGQKRNVPVNITSSPLFYRGGGTIILKQHVELSTADDDLSYLVIFNLDKNNYTTGHFYDDDRTSFEYKKGTYCYLQISYDRTDNTFSIRNLSDYRNCDYRFYIIYTNHLEKTETGYNVVQTEYNKTKSGQLLGSINIADEFLKQSQSRGSNDEIIFYL